MNVMPNGGFAGPFVVLMTLLASMYAPAIPSRWYAPCVDSIAPRAVPAPHSP
ncbi:hypothetical protein ACPCUK_28090 [Streptomyces arboris]|uniref:hypothetical protein n=1 Tax=Streptomyces arboris TaxID=2600619 RepID=UPI003C2D8E33